MIQTSLLNRVVVFTSDDKNRAGVIKNGKGVICGVFLNADPHRTQHIAYLVEVVANGVIHEMLATDFTLNLSVPY